MKNIKRHILFLFMGASLVGCGSQEEEAEVIVNEPPVLSLSQSSVVMDEGSIVSVPFTTSDDTTPYDKLSISLSVLNAAEKGAFEIDRAGKKVIYRSPWIDGSVSKTYQTRIALVVRDESGGVTTKEISVTVNDTDVPVSTKIVPPAQSFGADKTRTDTLVNVFLMDSQTNVSFDLDILEKDGDSISFEHGVPTNKYMFLSDVTPSETANGVRLTIASIPQIEEPSSQFSINTLVDDGDSSPSSATINVTIVNQVSLQWHADNPQLVSEVNGATLRYATSEKPGYAALVSTTLTDANGENVDIPFVLNSASQTISFPPLSKPIHGDASYVLTLTYSNDITSASGEVYKAISTISQTLLFKDDRDDTFEEMKALFSSQAVWIDDLSSRKDDLRVAKAVGNLLFIKGLSTEPEMILFKQSAQEAFDTEMSILKQKSADISKVISGPATDDLKSELSAFSDLFYKAGHSVRKISADFQKSQEEKHQIALGIKSVFDSAFNEKLPSVNISSHYVGNGAYGRFADANKTKWVYSPGFEYLSVVDVTDPYCF